jgi:hypothetical protein
MAEHGRAALRPRRARLIAPALVALAAVGIVLAWTSLAEGDRAMILGAGTLARLERAPAPELGRGFERWRMLGPGADTVTALWRSPASGSGSRAPGWSVVILGGIGTDDRAALLVPDSLPVGVLAVSWPWKGSRRMSRLQFVMSLGALRAALLRTPAALARGVRAVRQVEPGARVAMLGASLGVPPTVAALRHARPDGLVLVGGAADLGRLMRAEARRALGGGPLAAGLAGVSAPVGAWLLAPLEPSRAAGPARGIPTLLVDAEDEERLPRACITRLHATFPHAARATHPGRHLRPEDRRQMDSILSTVWGWLDGVAAGR